MKRHILAVAVVLGVVLAPSSSGAAPAERSAGPDIIGGEIVSQAYPWSVALVEDGSGSTSSRTFCSGSLIEPKWVLTASHCTSPWPGNADVTIVIGRRDLDESGGQTRRVIAIRRYPNADVALLELSSASTLSDLQLAGDPQADEWGIGSDARAYGYGVYTVGGSSGSRYLRRAELTIGGFTADHYELTADYPRRTACYGDSGGPLIVSTSAGPRQVGVTVRGQVDGNRNCIPGGTNWFVKTGSRGSPTNSPVYEWIVATT